MSSSADCNSPISVAERALYWRGRLRVRRAMPSLSLRSSSGTSLERAASAGMISSGSEMRAGERQHDFGAFPGGSSKPNVKNYLPIARESRARGTAPEVETASHGRPPQPATPPHPPSMAPQRYHAAE